MLGIKQRFQSDKPEWIGLYHSDANAGLFGGGCLHQYSFRGQEVLGFSGNITRLPSESIMNLGTCPFSSEVHVPWYRGYFRCLLELAAGFEQPVLGAENSAIRPAQN